MAYPWEGTEMCLETARTGRNTGKRCGNREIEGMEYCFRHVPEDMLEEAEEITGMRRCRHPIRGVKSKSTIEHCPNVAINGTDPPRCKDHGANLGGVLSQRAAKNVVQANADTRLATIMTEHGMRLMNAEPLEDPLSELLQLAGEIKELRLILRDYISAMDLSKWRYEKARIGEQIRAEILLYERATERHAQILIQIAKLGIKALQSRLQAEQLRQVDIALQAALQAAQVPLEKQMEARRVLVEHLRRAS